MAGIVYSEEVILCKILCKFMQLCMRPLPGLFILLVLAYEVAHSFACTVYLRLYGAHWKV